MKLQKLQNLGFFFVADVDSCLSWQFFSAQRDVFSRNDMAAAKTEVCRTCEGHGSRNAHVFPHIAPPKVENAHVFPIQNQKHHRNAHVFPITKYKTHGNALFPHSKHPVAWKHAMCIKCVSTSAIIIPIFSETLNTFPLQIGNARVFPPKNSKMIWKRVCA